MPETSSMPPQPSIPDDGQTPLCAVHSQQIHEVRGDIRELKVASINESALLRDVRERVIRLEARLDTISSSLTKHTDRASEMFFRYAWPLILVALTAAITRYVGK